MSEHAFSVKAALQFGWSGTKQHLKPLLVLGVLGAFLAFLDSALTGGQDARQLGWVLALPVRAVQLALMLILLRVALAVHDGKPFQLSQPLPLLEHYLAYLLASVMFAVLVSVGFVLLIVPGVYLALRYGLFGFAIADRGADPFEAFKASSRLTAGVKGDLFWFALAAFGVNLLGALALGVGLLVTVPITVLAAAHIYRRLEARAPQALQPHPPFTPHPSAP